MSRPLYFLLIAAVAIVACKSNDSSSQLEDLDLMSYGIPIVVKAPPGAEVKKMDLTFQQDVTVKSGEDYYLQIFASDASSQDAAEVKADLLKEVKQHPYFAELIRDENVGFIYKTELDSAHANYGFRYVKIQGDKEYTFQTGLIGTFTLEQVETMYDAVK